MSFSLIALLGVCVRVVVIFVVVSDWHVLLFACLCCCMCPCFALFGLFFVLCLVMFVCEFLLCVFCVCLCVFVCVLCVLCLCRCFCVFYARYCLCLVCVDLIGVVIVCLFCFSF